MSLIQGFLTNLLAMRSHYQAQINQCDRLIAHAQEQLLHVNALLVDDALDNQQFATNLLQMRSHLQAAVNEQKRLSASARDQLIHINALLAEQMVVQHGNDQAISMQATSYRDDWALTEAVESKEIPTAVERLKADSISQQQVEAVDAASQEQPTSVPEQTSSTVIPQGEQGEELIENQSSSVANDLPTLEVEQAPLANQVSTHNHPKTPLLTEYQHLTRSEAVEKLLQENIGTILHADYIVRSLYGNLEPEAFKVEKQRLYETLGKGIAKGLWDRVPDQPGCYTIDLKLVDKEEKSPPTSHQQAAKVESDGRIEVLSAYQHLNFTQAVETVLRENAGQVMNSEKVARILYGELSAKELSRAKDKIGKILWAGARQKKWQGVMGKLGAYTMANNAVQLG